MAKYIDYEYYISLYGTDSLTEQEFNRLSFDAEREVDKATSGIDNVKKLTVAFPTNEEDAEIVKRCVCGLIDLLYQIEQAEKNANNVGQYIQRADGSLQGKVISAVSAGNESISYAVGKSADTVINNAIKSVNDKKITISAFIADKLQGVSDANGINLLYMGKYPYYVEV